MKFKCVLGGTFDHLHEGHRALLDTAISQNKHLIIGLTTGDLIKNKKYSELIQSFEERKQDLINFLRNEKQFDDFEVQEVIIVDY
jgi:pantetheine-phosphate adenylyltransferase